MPFDECLLSFIIIIIVIHVRRAKWGNSKGPSHKTPSTESFQGIILWQFLQKALQGSYGNVPKSPCKAQLCVGRQGFRINVFTRARLWLNGAPLAFRRQHWSEICPLEFRFIRKNGVAEMAYLLCGSDYVTQLLLV